MGRFAERRAAVRPLLSVARSLSFSQYGEDLLLSVTLLPTNSGVYVDVGAYHPWRASNTYKLYLKGWSGLTIEPNPDVAAAFRKLRPRDIHHTGGIAAEEGELTYRRFSDAKLNTFSDRQAAKYQALGFKLIGEAKLPCRPLKDVLDEHGVTQVDLLSIDCEGYDLVALETFDFERRRPTAILVEDYDAFEKLKNGAGDSAIEDLLRARDYAHVGQALFSSLYVDREALRRRTAGAYRMPAVQFAERDADAASGVDD
jgi:FkbM family methyltransferase